MPTLSWYWHRLRAMGPGEIALQARKKWRQLSDARRAWDFSGVKLECSGAFPKLPKPEDAPDVLREALRGDTENILAGRWKAFGHLDIQVDDPPKWHKDYLVGQDLATEESAFRLDYRELPDGADIKLIWELSRWHQLTRLAMAAYVLGEERAAVKCVEWLEDWVKRNPPYRGWNWTSALEVGMRLVQFAWIDALLTGAAVSGSGFRVSSLAGGEGAGNPQLVERLERLRRAILLPHVWYAWRHKSFGSSANNHLIGELAGLILATVRWPALAQWGAPLDELQSRWEQEVLAQFAEDGGNKEQALNYHLFSWEFSWQARMALAGSGRSVGPEIDERLSRATQFYVDVQVPSDPWDYGDSDNGFVVPFFADDQEVVAEWHEWFREPREDQALEYWMGDGSQYLKFEFPRIKQADRRFQTSGYAVQREGDWTVRWDLSPLGLGALAAHGHLDALHASIWWRGVAIAIDPGTGAYFADQRLRNWLASAAAHNVINPFALETIAWPTRFGPFIWRETWLQPILEENRTARLDMLGRSESFRKIRLDAERGLLIEDHALYDGMANDFQIRWQFAPGSRLDVLIERRFRVSRRGVATEVQVSADWAEVFCVTEPGQVLKADPDAPLAGTVSPAFRKTVWAPYLKLVARPRGDKPCVFRTTFLASAS
jgi:hypothetical protein